MPWERKPRARSWREEPWLVSWPACGRGTANILQNITRAKTAFFLCTSLSFSFRTRHREVHGTTLWGCLPGWAGLTLMRITVLVTLSFEEKAHRFRDLQARASTIRRFASLR